MALVKPQRRRPRRKSIEGGVIQTTGVAISGASTPAGGSSSARRWRCR
nr:MAG TPA: hypothetical protein [Caudoviricetes sp.]